jgi:hypothetical protein
MKSERLLAGCISELESPTVTFFFYSFKLGSPPEFVTINTISSLDLMPGEYLAVAVKRGFLHRRNIVLAYRRLGQRGGTQACGYVFVPLQFFIGGSALTTLWKAMVLGHRLGAIFLLLSGVALIFAATDRLLRIWRAVRQLNLYKTID